MWREGEEILAGVAVPTCRGQPQTQNIAVFAE
jgi:hypothetical protein